MRGKISLSSNNHIFFIHYMFRFEGWFVFFKWKPKSSSRTATAVLIALPHTSIQKLWVKRPGEAARMTQKIISYIHSIFLFYYVFFLPLVFGGLQSSWFWAIFSWDQKFRNVLLLKLPFLGSHTTSEKRIQYTVPNAGRADAPKGTHTGQGIWTFSISTVCSLRVCILSSGLMKSSCGNSL